MTNRSSRTWSNGSCFPQLHRPPASSAAPIRQPHQREGQESQHRRPPSPVQLPPISKPRQRAQQEDQQRQQQQGYQQQQQYPRHQRESQPQQHQPQYPAQ